MIYTYEHDALRTILDEGHGDHLLFRTIPELRFTRYLLPLTDGGRLLARAFGTPQVRRSLRAERVRIPPVVPEGADIADAEAFEKAVSALHTTMRSRAAPVAPVSWSERTLPVDCVRIKIFLAEYRQDRNG